MTYEVTIPEIGESITEALIVRWIKQAGEAVGRDEPLVELETDKVTVEMPSPVAGVVAEIVCAEGETVPVGGVIARIEEGATATVAAARRRHRRQRSRRRHPAPPLRTRASRPHPRPPPPRQPRNHRASCPRRSA